MFWKRLAAETKATRIKKLISKSLFPGKQTEKEQPPSMDFQGKHLSKAIKQTGSNSLW